MEVYFGKNWDQEQPYGIVHEMNREVQAMLHTGIKLILRN
jgi:hypothetical protein